jgi:hypothetical protein
MKVDWRYRFYLKGGHVLVGRLQSANDCHVTIIDSVDGKITVIHETRIVAITELGS